VASKLAQRALRLSGTAVAVLAGAAATAAPASAGYLNGCTKPGVNLYASAGLAQGYGSMYCASNVKSMELEVDLYEHWTSDNAWHLMAARTIGPTSPGGGKTIGTQSPATAPCKDSSQRQWKVIASGYADIGGTWFADQSSLQETLNCRG
jgi:hypothetical protein